MANTLLGGCFRLGRMHHAIADGQTALCMSGVKRISIQRGHHSHICGILGKHFKAPRCAKYFSTTVLPMGLPSELLMTQGWYCYAGGPNAASAELLLSEQQKLQEAYPGVPPPEMLSGARLSGQQAEVQHLNFGFLSRLSMLLDRMTS